MLDEECNTCSSELTDFLHSFVISTLLDPFIFLSILFSKALYLCSSLKVRDQVSQPYNTSSNIIFLYVLTLISWEAGGTLKVFQVNNNMHFPYLLCV